MNAPSLVLLGMLLGSPQGEPATTPSHAFAELDGHYQSIRLALLNDRTKGVSDAASAMAKLVRSLGERPSADRLGVAEADVEAVRELLAEVAGRARALSESEGIAAQREALKRLTRPMVRWHEKVAGQRPRLAYCSMERGAWFQPDGVLGNPYGGQRMPRCGVLVD